MEVLYKQFLLLFGGGNTLCVHGNWPDLISRSWFSGLFISTFLVIRSTEQIYTINVLPHK